MDMSDANDTKAAFESWFTDEWAAFEDKPIFSEIKAKVWALKAWYARGASKSWNGETDQWAPERIYLQREQGEGGSHTWCEDSVGDGDLIEEVAYVRVDCINNPI